MIQFDGFVGNEKLKDRLSKMIERKSVPQAMVFEGKQGLGKRTIVTQFVRALLCNNSDVRPCGVCPTSAAMVPVLSFTSVNMVVRLLDTKFVRSSLMASSIFSNKSNNRYFLLTF